MKLTDTLKANYWKVLMDHAHRYVGSASLGSTDYQHLGITIAPGATSRCQAVLLQYAQATATSEDPSALFDAVLNTHMFRMAHRDGDGYYIELWSAYPSVPFDHSEEDRQNFVRFLETLTSPVLKTTWLIRNLSAALQAAESLDERKHPFDDLEALALDSDPLVQEGYTTEFERRRRNRVLIAQAQDHLVSTP